MTDQPIKRVVTEITLKELLDLHNKTQGAFRADFSYGDLTQVDLRGKEMAGVIFHRARLTQADMMNVDIRVVDFSHANLAEADLRDAECLKSNFEGADLSFANFSRADLTECNLIGANLEGAIFDWARLRDCFVTTKELEKANLSRIRNEFIVGLLGQIMDLDLLKSQIRNADGGTFRELFNGGYNETPFSPPPTLNAIDFWVSSFGRAKDCPLKEMTCSWIDGLISKKEIGL